MARLRKQSYRGSHRVETELPSVDQSLTMRIRWIGGTNVRGQPLQSPQFEESRSDQVQRQGFSSRASLTAWMSCLIRCWSSGLKAPLSSAVLILRAARSAANIW